MKEMPLIAGPDPHSYIFRRPDFEWYLPDFLDKACDVLTAVTCMFEESKHCTILSLFETTSHMLCRVEGMQNCLYAMGKY